MDGYWVTNSMLYLVNYDPEGNIIDYIRVASYICEGGYSCCTINQHNIWYISYEECPVKFKYAVHEVIPMIESRLKYDIGTDGHFSKKEVDCFFRRSDSDPSPESRPCVVERWSILTRMHSVSVSAAIKKKWHVEKIPFFPCWII